jgi:hypothetical protein
LPSLAAIKSCHSLMTDKFFQDCDTSGKYRFQCALSAGRDLSNYFASAGSSPLRKLPSRRRRL